jgi:hypothetical protein
MYRDHTVDPKNLTDGLLCSGLIKMVRQLLTHNSYPINTSIDMASHIPKRQVSYRGPSNQTQPSTSRHPLHLIRNAKEYRLCDSPRMSQLLTTFP